MAMATCLADVLLHMLLCTSFVPLAPSLHIIRAVGALQDRLKLHVHRSLPIACPLCSGTDHSRSGCPNLYRASLQVFHGASLCNV